MDTDQYRGWLKEAGRAISHSLEGIKDMRKKPNERKKKFRPKQKEKKQKEKEAKRRKKEKKNDIC